jgi:hypothetical protein
MTRLAGRYHRSVTLDPPIEFPPVQAGEDIVVSASLFATYERCPEQAGGRLRGVYGPESRASFTGGLAHRIFRRHLTEGPIDGADLPAVCREEIGTSMNPKLAALGLRPSELGRVIEEVGSLYQRFRTVGSEGFAGAEVALEVEPHRGLTLRGSIDAVFDDAAAGTRLVDWKTGSLGDPEPQLSFYALLWALKQGELPGRVEAVSVASGERYEEVPTRGGVVDVAGRVAEAVSRLRTAWAAGEGLRRVAGPWCRWCPLLDECSEGRAATALIDGGRSGAAQPDHGG